MIAVADEPEQRLGKTIQDVTLEQVHSSGPVHLRDENQQFACPTHADLPDATHLFTVSPIRMSQVKNHSIKAPFVEQGLQGFTGLRQGRLAFNPFQEAKKISD